jgi:hypothetical protein
MYWSGLTGPVERDGSSALCWEGLLRLNRRLSFVRRGRWDDVMRVCEYDVWCMMCLCDLLLDSFGVAVLMDVDQSVGSVLDS